MVNIKNVVLGIAIIVLTISVVVYGINAFYDKPEYDDFCSGNIRAPKIVEGERICPSVCVKMYEIKENTCVLDECGSGCGADGINTFESLEQCENSLDIKDCYDVYNKASEKYYRNVFLITLPLGILLIIVGAMIFGLEVVGAGLMGGGVGVILFGVGGYWRFSEDVLKFILSLIGLVAVILVSYWFNKKHGKK